MMHSLPFLSPLSSLWQRKETRLLLPFLLLFFSSFFLSTAGNRVVFYAISPVFLVALYGARDTVLPYLRTVSFALFATYTAYFALSSLWSQGAGESEYLHALRDFLCLGVFVCAFVLMLDGIKGRLSKRTLFFLAAAAVMSVLVFAFLYYGLADKGFHKRFRGFGRYENPIHLSFLLCFCILFLLSLGRMAQEGLEFARYGFISLALVLMLMTQTRTSLLALGACPVAFFALFGGRKVAWTLIAGLAVTVILALFAFHFPFLELITRGDAYRFAIWRDALETVKEGNLFFGMGLSAEPHLGADAAYPQGWKSAHNVYIGHLYVGGIAGLGLFLLLYGNMLWQGTKAFFFYRTNAQEQTFLSFTILSLVFLSVAQILNFDHYLINVYIHWLVFWIPFALCWRLEIQRRQEQKHIREKC